MTIEKMRIHVRFYEAQLAELRRYKEVTTTQLEEASRLLWIARGELLAVEMRRAS